MRTAWYARQARSPTGRPARPRSTPSSRPTRRSPCRNRSATGSVPAWASRASLCTVRSSGTAHLRFHRALARRARRGRVPCRAAGPIGGAGVLGTVRRTADPGPALTGRWLCVRLPSTPPTSSSRFGAHASHAVDRVVEVSLSDKADLEVQLLARRWSDHPLTPAGVTARVAVLAAALRQRHASPARQRRTFRPPSSSRPPPTSPRRPPTVP
jgi:hypothetical protein